MAGVRKRKTATEKKRAPSKEPAPLKIEPPAPPEELIQSLKPGERRELPVLPVRHTVLFPLAILPLNVGRPSSVQLLNHCMQTDRMLAVFAQKNPEEDAPKPDELHETGTLG